MSPENDNPVGSMGNQGSQDFDSMVANEGTSGQTSAPTQPPLSGEAAGTTSDAQGGIPQKQLPKEEPAAPSTVPPAQQSQADIIRATAEAVAAAHQRGQQSQQPQQQPRAELSPEEFTKKFNVTRANTDLVTAILGQDPVKAAAALDQYGQNLVKQAILMTMELTEANIGKFREEVTPHISSWQQHQREQQAVAAEQRFFKTAPDLVNERDLVMELKDAFIAKVQAGQVRFANEAEAFSAVANAARTILKRVNPQWGQAGGGQQAPTAGQQTGRRMSVASSTGRSGTGQATAKSDVDTVFGPDAH